MTRLLPRAALIRTGPVDRADWNYRPVLGWIQRRRFALAEELLVGGRVGKLLEIGYGSGVFMPALVTRCEELHGVDVHSRAAEVQTRLVDCGVKAQLASGSAEELPYENALFDAVVAVSCLEFVDEIGLAAREIQRVLKPTGCLVLVTPGRSVVGDWGLRLLTGQSARKDYQDRRERLMPTLLQHFSIESQMRFPRFLGNGWCLYRALRMRSLPQQGYDERVKTATVRLPVAAEAIEA